MLTALGLSLVAGGERTLVKAHALRLGLDVRHLGNASLRPADSCQLKPELTQLRRAAESLAAAWFVLCGRNVAFPVEPDTYDLLVDMPDGLKRVQVKTTTFKSKAGWLAQIGRRPYSIGNNAALVPYDPEVIDLFFIIDGDLAMYLIPSRVIAGRVQILLRTYRDFIVANAAGLILPRPSAA
ncbi:MAG: group I intron-associated PD-(D/E)XK endonuclease [Streptosporangiaceae bacterium]